MSLFLWRLAPASAPPSTTSEPHQMSLSDLRLSASTNQLSKSTSVTPTGSLLCVHNTVQLRESTLTVNYPDSGVGDSSKGNQKSLLKSKSIAPDETRNTNRLKYGKTTQNDNNFAALIDIKQLQTNDFKDDEASCTNAASSDVDLIGEDGSVRWRKSHPSLTRVKSVPVIPQQLVTSSHRRSSINDMTRELEISKPSSEHDHRAFSVDTIRSPDSESSTSTLSSALFYTETDSTIGFSTDLPDDLLSLGYSEFKAYSSDGSYSASYLTSDTLTASESSEDECVKTEFKPKDSLTLFCKSTSTSPSMDGKGSRVTANPTKLSLNITEIGSPRVNFLVPSQSEVTQAHVKERNSTSRKKVLQKESAPSLRTSMQQEITQDRNFKSFSSLGESNNKKNKTRKTSRSSSISLTPSSYPERNSIINDNADQNINNSSNETILEKDNALPDESVLPNGENEKNDMIRRSISQLSPRSRSSLFKYMDTDVVKHTQREQNVSPSNTIEINSKSPSMAGQWDKRDTTQFYYLCNISGDEDNEVDDDATPRAQSDSDVVSETADATKNMPNPESKETVKLANVEVKLVDNLENAIKSDQEEATQDMLQHIRSSVQELENLIESDLESEGDLESDPKLDVGNHYISPDLRQMQSYVANNTENDSVESFSSTVDNAKEKFLCLVQHQTSLVQDEVIDNDVANDGKYNENEKATTTFPSEPNESLNNGNDQVIDNANTNLDPQQGPAEWGIYEEFPSLTNSPEDIFEDAASAEHAFPYDDDGEVSLLYSRHEKIPMKDFAAEIRASMDVENFLNSAILLLNLDEASIDAILDRMLRPLIVDNDEPVTMAEAKRAIFTHDSVHKLAKTIQGTCCTYSGAFDYDQSWLCILCTMPALQRRHVAIARLRTPQNLGRTSQEVYFIILVVAPTKEKGTKNALETGRTFATLFADIDLRQQLLCVNSHDEFKKLLWEHTKELAEEQSHPDRKLSGADQGIIDEDKTMCWFAKGLRQDFKRRLPHYWSDFKDGIVGPHTPHKTMATTVFVYFACLLPSIAFGMLNDTNTKGKMDVKKVIWSQTIGGLIFAFVGGQPLVVLLTTAPLALYTKVIYNICDDWDLDFFAMYACVGLWNMMFLLLYAVSDASRLMKWSTRSTEEIFALFISIAFMVDAFRDVYNNFQENYNSPACSSDTPASSTLLNGSAAQVLETTLSSIVNETNSSKVAHAVGNEVCLRENSLLYLLLCLGTLWLGISLFNFTKTPYLNASKREILADYALPFAVIIMSFFGSYVFRSVKLQPFNFYDGAIFHWPPLGKLPWGGVLGAMALGFPLSLLFFMDQNISSAMVNSPANKLKKGPAYHWDMMIIAFLNGVLSFYGLPMVHGALPHSPLHVRALADVEDYVEQGHVYQKIVRVRETRVTGVTAHILIGLSILMLPNPLSYIPRAVLDGLFLYLAINALNHNQLFDRILLLATEQAAYPPNHYIRSVPQRKVHMFTGAQILQLAVMCGFGFSPYPYLKMTFPVIILLLLPIRHKLVPRLIEKKYLEYLDG